MILRRVLKFNSTLGFTIPGQFAQALGLHWKDYIEIRVVDKDTILVKKHELNDEIRRVEIEDRIQNGG